MGTLDDAAERGKCVPDGPLSYGMEVEMMKQDAQRQEPLVPVIASMLEETVSRNEKNCKKSSLPSFHGRRPPLSASDFVTRVAKYSGASPCCFAVGLIYMERLKKRDAGVCLTPGNFQRLFLVAVMSASKFLDDFYYSNKHWAEVGGIQTVELNRLELEFLFRMGFRLHMQRGEYDWFTEELHARVRPEHIAAAEAFSAPAVQTTATATPAPTAAPAIKASHCAAQTKPALGAAPATNAGADVNSYSSANTMPSCSSVPLARNTSGSHFTQVPHSRKYSGQGGGSGVHLNWQLHPRHIENLPSGVNRKMDWVYC